MSDILSITVRIMPSAEEFAVELPRFSTGREIREELLNANVAPRSSPQGEPYVYELVIKATNLRLEESKTLSDSGVQHGDIILFIPNHLVAG